MLAIFEPFLYYKFLLFQLTQKEIKARYKQSFLGYAWVIFNPFAQLLVYSFVFSIVFRFPTGNEPYSIFLFAGLLPWVFTQTSIAGGTESLVNNASLLKKVRFPREVIPYSFVLAKIVDFLFSSIVFIVFLYFYKVSLAWTALLVPVIFLVQLILTMGITLLLSAANLFYRDIQYLTNLVLMLWMYMTPVVYPLSMVPRQYVWLYKLNPMVGIIEAYRSALFGYQIEWSIFWWAAALSIGIFAVAYTIFKFSEKYFADIV